MSKAPEVAKTIKFVPDPFGKDTDWKFGAKVEFPRLTQGTIQGYTYEGAEIKLVIVDDNKGFWIIDAKKVVKL